jgi:hypothetical protein
MFGIINIFDSDIELETLILIYSIVFLVEVILIGSVFQIYLIKKRDSLIKKNDFFIKKLLTEYYNIANGYDIFDTSSLLHAKKVSRMREINDYLYKYYNTLYGLLRMEKVEGSSFRKMYKYNILSDNDIFLESLSEQADIQIIQGQEGIPYFDYLRRIWLAKVIQQEIEFMKIQETEPYSIINTKNFLLDDFEDGTAAYRYYDSQDNLLLERHYKEGKFIENKENINNVET